MLGYEKLVFLLLMILGTLNHAGACGSRTVLEVKELEKGGWRMVFRGTSSNGYSVYDAWVHGKNTISEKPYTMKRTHNKHYRDDVVNNWAKLRVREVKFAFYDENEEVAYVTFDGTKKSLINWFGKSNVIESSWPDLTSYANYNIFSIEGDFRQHELDRRFLISKVYAGCGGDIGHMVVINSDQKFGCSWDNHATYPQFLYSTINSADFWGKNRFGTADYMAIFIRTWKYEEKAGLV